MFSIEINQDFAVYNGILIPETDYGRIVGYTALREYYSLAIPMPSRLSIVSPKNRKVHTSRYQLYQSAYMPEENLLSHLRFALKYEGVNLLVLKRLFSKIEVEEISDILNQASGIYMRKVWYLYEWLTETKLEIADASKKINYALLADPKVQFSLQSKQAQLKSERHRIINNLLGTKNYCPHIYITKEITEFQQMELHSEKRQFGSLQSSSILKRANAYLLLKDSKASFAIEGENPKPTRLSGWAQAIGQAGMHALTKQELIRLQQLVLPTKMQQKINMGYRIEGGFIGDYEKDTNMPRPEHISARAEDLQALMGGLLETNERLQEDDIDAVVVATIIAFGFVFIHPFVDGNGRIHRYIIHHILSSKRFTPEGVVFPVSASIVNNVHEYASVLKKYSLPLLEYIEWETTRDKNVRVTNDSSDLYRYYDATHLVEYLYACIQDTVEEIIPYEIEMLRKFDEFKEIVELEIGLPDNKIKLLSNFLLDNNGTLSKRKRENHFQSITDDELISIHKVFKNIYDT